MKHLLLFLSFVGVYMIGFSQSGQQKPSREQMEADQKRFAEAQKKLEATKSAMDPKARKLYDSMMNSMGVGEKMDKAVGAISTSAPGTKGGIAKATGIVPAKDSKKIAAIMATPSADKMGAYLAGVNSKAAAAVLPAARSKGEEIFKALTAKKASAADAGNAAMALWISGKSQIALYVLAQVCAADPSNADNLNNYASMLQMMGAPELAIPVLNSLNARFRNNTTILNNLGQAWFALGDIDRADKYLDSTLRIFAAHPQANLTKSFIDESKGNKTAAVAHAKAAFKQAYSSEKADRLQKLGYTPGPDDYNYPTEKKSADLLNLGAFTMPPFPKSVAECIALEPVWKQFRMEADQRMKPLQKMSDDYNKATLEMMQQKMNQGVAMKNRILDNPGSVTQADAVRLMDLPVYSEKVGAKQKLVLENIQRKKLEVGQKLVAFVNGEGAALRKKYEDAKQRILQQMKDDEKKSVSGTVDPGAYCPQYVKASDEFLQPYNTKLEELYTELLGVEKQLLNEFAYTNLYTTWPEVTALANAGMQIQWLRDISLSGFQFESITKYTCADEDEGKSGQLAEFKNPNCDINSELKTMVGKIVVTCSGITSQLSLGAFGVELKQDLDHDLFGDGFKSCTVSVGPKIGAKVGAGPVQVGVEGSAGVDIEFDRQGVKDVTVKAGAEASAGLGGPVSASGGMEGSMSLSSGVGSISGTGIFK